jgi:hypothetical protein
MKQVILTTFFLCSTFLPALTQDLVFEYVQYQRNARKATVQLPDFIVPLKKSYREERSEFRKPSQLFVVSDIEGQYEYFKQLLRSAGVIDENFNWTFGKGHLVVCGDVFDRGSQVAECLWLIYLLEDKAKEQGGYVHYVLGNHEIMNLNRDYRYVNPKYMELAQEKSISYDNFYNKETELGQWLRTKNIMEKIGDLLFLHAGVSQYINELEQDINYINTVARGYYDQTEDSIPPLAQLLLLDEGPLWYRGYFMPPWATKQQVDSTLELFRVKKIIIGHTPVNRISTFFNGKVINVDVPHAKGASEGLFIEDKKYYRVGLKGEKELMSNDE